MIPVGPGFSVRLLRRTRVSRAPSVRGQPAVCLGGRQDTHVFLGGESLMRFPGAARRQDVAASEPQ